MLENILKLEHDNIDLYAQRMKDVVSYIVDYINSDFENISRVFSPYIDKDFRERSNNLVISYNLDNVKNEFSERKLYEYVRSMIKGLNDEAVRAGIRTYRNNVLVPDVQLGLSHYIKGDGVSITKKLTEKGVDVIDGYRAAMGKLTINEAREELEKKILLF